MTDIQPGDAKFSKIEYMRLIGLWGAVFVLVIFSYQLGQWNAHNIVNEIHTFCSNATHYSVGILGDTGLWINNSIPSTIIP